MDIKKRLFRKPISAVLFTVLSAVMTAFFAVSAALCCSSRRLSADLDGKHTAIAVRTDPQFESRCIYDVEGGDPTRVIGVSYAKTERSFTDEDRAKLEAIAYVKKVREHALSGASSPSFYPVFDIRSERSWRADGDDTPYSLCVFAGELVEKQRSGSGLMMLFSLEEVLLANSEYDPMLNAMRFKGSFCYIADTYDDPSAADYFTEGERYAVCGHIISPGEGVDAFDVQRFGGGAYVVLYAGSVRKAGSVHLGQKTRSMASVMAESGQSYEGGDDFNYRLSYPAFEKLEGTAEDFFADTPNEEWRSFKREWEMQNHSLPVIGTDRLETIYAFLNGEATIVEGRSFTRQEYESGAKSVIISERTARKGNISAGDLIEISQYAPAYTVRENFTWRGVVSSQINNPVVDAATDHERGEYERFTVVGIYSLEADWTDGSYSITPNTVFMPRAAQVSGALTRLSDPIYEYAADNAHETADSYGILLSVELENGNVDDFRLALARSEYADQFLCCDQGFEAVQKNVNGMRESSEKLLPIAAAAWIMYAAIYILMFQNPQKRDIGTMLSLGAPRRQAARYLFGSGAIVASAGAALGAAASCAALEVIGKHILSDALAEIDRSAHSGVPVISEQQLAEMVKASSPDAPALVLTAAALLALLLAALMLHAAVLSQMGPRELIGGK